MGWWATDVFGGDRPCDLLDAAGNLLKFGNETLPTPDEWDTAIRQRVRDGIAHLGGVNQFAAALGVDSETVIGDTVHHDDQVAVQVVAAIAVGAGVPLDDTWRERAMYATQCDLWAHQNADRCADMKEFYNMIAAYDGTPATTNHRSLFDTISRAFDN